MSASKSSEAKVVVQEAPADEETKEVGTGAEEVPVEAGERKKRTHRVVDKASVQKSIDDHLERIVTKIEELKSNKSEKKGIIRFLMSLKKESKILSGDFAKIMKMKPKRQHKAVSGFMRPVRIDEPLRRFLGAGWEEDKSYCRNEVTKAVCKYIRDHNLKDPVEKKCINPDQALIDIGIVGKIPGTEDRLTYLRLQRLLTPHYTKIDVKAEEAQSAPVS